MLCRRWQSYFTRQPLNYESLQRRCAEFDRRTSHPPSLLKDYIVANRRLQNINKSLDPQYRYGSANKFLCLQLNVPAQKLESDLRSFVDKYWSFCVDDADVVCAFVSSAPPGEIGHAFHIVNDSFSRLYKKDTGASLRPVTALVHVLLRQNDFHGCFKILDNTVNSSAFVRFVKLQLLRKLVVPFSGVLCSLVGAAWSLSSTYVACLGGFTFGPLATIVTAMWPITLMCFVGILGAQASLVMAMTPRRLSRVSWRPHTSFAHRYMHQFEASLVNKIVTYFEEFHEVNVKNFHTSGLRNPASLRTFDSNNYELMSPESLAVGTRTNDDQLEVQVKNVRLELNRRRLVWNPLKEERMFLDFWMNHGENYEWVEPDQDPAEMAILSGPKAEETTR